MPYKLTTDQALALVRYQSTSCMICRFPIVAMSEQAMRDAGREHANYIAATCDPATDPHLEDLRRERLI